MSGLNPTSISALGLLGPLLLLPELHWVPAPGHLGYAKPTSLHMSGSAVWLTLWLTRQQWCWQSFLMPRIGWVGAIDVADVLLIFVLFGWRLVGAVTMPRTLRISLR